MYGHWHIHIHVQHNEMVCCLYLPREGWVWQHQMDMEDSSCSSSVAPARHFTNLVNQSLIAYLSLRTKTILYQTLCTTSQESTSYHNVATLYDYKLKFVINHIIFTEHINRCCACDFSLFSDVNVHLKWTILTLNHPTCITTFFSFVLAGHACGLKLTVKAFFDDTESNGTWDRTIWTHF